MATRWLCAGPCATSGTCACDKRPSGPSGPRPRNCAQMSAEANCFDRARGLAARTFDGAGSQAQRGSNAPVLALSAHTCARHEGILPEALSVPPPDSPSTGAGRAAPGMC